MSNDKNNFSVKIYGCTHKELLIHQEKITLKEISKMVGLDESTQYVIEDKLYQPDYELQLYDNIELECKSMAKSDPIYHVKVSGCTNKVIEFDKQIVTLSEVSKKAGIPEDTLYIVNGKSESASTKITLTDGIELECKKLGRDS